MAARFSSLLVAVVSTAAIAGGVADIDRKIGRSTSVTAPALGTPGCYGDFNLDGVVDQDDFPLFAVSYDYLLCDEPPLSSGPCLADWNGDRFVDDTDYIAFSHAYNDYDCP